MCSEPSPKEFEKTVELLPLTRYGLSSLGEFRNEEDVISKKEWLKRAGLTDEEIKLYHDKEAGCVDQYKNVESSILNIKLVDIYNKIDRYKETERASLIEKPSTSSQCKSENIIEKCKKKPISFYPEGHPMNELEEIEESLFGHLKNDDIIPITKRRKILRRLERRKECVLAQEKHLIISSPPSTSYRPGSLWDLKEVPVKIHQNTTHKHLIGPKKQTMYTIKDNKIVRLEPVQNQQDEYEAVDIVVPVNAAEEQLLEGTKMSVDDIRKIERFKDYMPGTPSKVIYLKNISPTVTQEELGLLFNQFQLENRGPVDVRLMSGRMRGQAFVSFLSEELAIRALEEVNGTILSGRPLVAQFGRNSNRVQDNG